MKLYVTVEEFLYAKKIENQTERTLRGYKNALNLFANWLQKEWTIDELEKIRVVHLKQYVAYHLKMGHKNGMDIYTLSRLLGHEKVSITQIYLQNMQDAQIVENAVNRSVIASLKKS